MRRFGSLITLISAVTIMLFDLAFAAEASLTLTVSGNRDATPRWQDATGSDITTLDFSFNSITGTAGSNVDSTTKTIKLVNASTYPATVAITAPSSCLIGSAAVSNADVQILFGGLAADPSISIPSDSLQTFAIRFLAAGNYGNKPGAVSCSNNGMLRYTY